MLFRHSSTRSALALDRSWWSKVAFLSGFSWQRWSYGYHYIINPVSWDSTYIAYNHLCISTNMAQPTAEPLLLSWRHTSGESLPAKRSEREPGFPTLDAKLAQQSRWPPALPELKPISWQPQLRPSMGSSHYPNTIAISLWRWIDEHPPINECIYIYIYIYRKVGFQPPIWQGLG